MKIALELKEEKKRLAKVELETQNGISDFRRAMDSLFSIINGDNVSKEEIDEEHLKVIEQIKKSFCENTERETKKAEKRGQTKKPEIIHEEVVVPMEIEYEEALKRGEKPDTYINEEAYKKEDNQEVPDEPDNQEIPSEPKNYFGINAGEIHTNLSNKKPREIFLGCKCPICGKEKFFKTRENAGIVFGCDNDDFSQEITDTVAVKYQCSNCGNEGYMRTLRGMDISDMLKCGRCESPIDLKYNEKRDRWESL